MEKHNIPQDKKQAEIHLLAAKEALLNIAAMIAGEHATVDQLNSRIWKDVNAINAMLDGADYEEAANLDHMTENQFNV